MKIDLSTICDSTGAADCAGKLNTILQQPGIEIDGAGGQYRIMKTVVIAQDKARLANLTIIKDLSLRNIAVLAQKPIPTPGGYPPPLYGLQALDVSIIAEGAGLDDAGLFQLNACHGFRLKRIRIQGDGKGMLASKTDGLVLAYRSTGDMEYIDIDGIPKAGLYFSEAFDVAARHIRITNGYLTNPTISDCAGVAIGDAQEIRLDGVTIAGMKSWAALSGIGVKFRDTPISAARNISICGLHISGCAQAGVWIAGVTHGPPTNVTVQGHIEGARAPLALDSGANVRYEITVN